MGIGVPDPADCSEYLAYMGAGCAHQPQLSRLTVIHSISHIVECRLVCAMPTVSQITIAEYSFSRDKLPKSLSYPLKRFLLDAAPQRIANAMSLARKGESGR